LKIEPREEEEEEEEEINQVIGMTTKHNVITKERKKEREKNVDEII
jgi:hypothetical protein